VESIAYWQVTFLRQENSIGSNEVTGITNGHTLRDIVLYKFV